MWGWIVGHGSPTFQAHMGLYCTCHGLQQGTPIPLFFLIPFVCSHACVMRPLPLHHAAHTRDVAFMKPCSVLIFAYGGHSNVMWTPPMHPMHAPCAQCASCAHAGSHKLSLALQPLIKEACVLRDDLWNVFSAGKDFR